MPPTTNNDWMRYGALAMQFFVSIGLAMWAGLKSDQWIRFGFPLLSWLLPTLIVVITLYKIFKETSRRK